MEPTPTALATTTALPTRAAPRVGAPRLLQVLPGTEVTLRPDISVENSLPPLLRLQCAPRGSEFDPERGIVRWVPSDNELGFFLVRVAGCDPIDPAVCAEWEGFFEVQKPPACHTPRCDSYTGCEWTPVPITEECCRSVKDETEARVAVLPCPAGKQLLIGKNLIEGFGVLRDCNRFRVINFGQVSAIVRLNFAVRCLDVTEPVVLSARMATAERELFDAPQVVLRFEASQGGFAERRGVAFPVRGPGPFFEFEDAEAELVVQARDHTGEQVETTLRLVLTFDELPDSSDLPFSAPACEILTEQH